MEKTCSVIQQVPIIPTVKRKYKINKQNKRKRNATKISYPSADLMMMKQQWL